MNKKRLLSIAAALAIAAASGFVGFKAAAPARGATNVVTDPCTASILPGSNIAIADVYFDWTYDHNINFLCTINPEGVMFAGTATIVHMQNAYLPTVQTDK